MSSRIVDEDFPTEFDAAMRAPLSGSETLGGFFDDLAQGVSSAVNSASSASTSIVDAANATKAQGDALYVSITTQWLAIMATNIQATSPEINTYLVAWQAFAVNWDKGNKDYGGLPQQASNLAKVQALVAVAKAPPKPYTPPSPSPAAPKPAPPAVPVAPPKKLGIGASLGGLLHLSKSGAITLGAAVLGIGLVGFGIFYHAGKK